ncbi:hypothetical protein PT974_11057 [Cladobotryum mycophilum]|uniref:Uncharacterized protein n=1 Tax=Cladobotryum mycophilum TaxID=491253 RepID=A0ABR0SBJ7_9HYPO
MITVSRGDWRQPIYTRESKETFYALIRGPLGNTSGDDPTTANLKDEEIRVAFMKSSDLLQTIVRNEVEPTPGILRTIWQWGLGYIFHERLNDPRMVAVLSAGIVEFTSDPAQFESIRQDMLDIQERADELADSVLRADSRRSMVEYLNVRTFYRVSGHGTNPAVRIEGDALATLAAGGVGLGRPTSWLFIFSPSWSLYFTRDLRLICDYIETVDGRELSIAAHFVASNNIHSRYIMLPVFLASSRLGEDRERRILDAIHRLWVIVEATDKDGSDDAIAAAQRALHRFIDEETQWACWKKADPAVLWAVCAGMFWASSNIDGMASFMMRGDDFKSLYVETEGFDMVWLREIFDAQHLGA